MPTLRDDLIPIVDELRREVVDGIAGLRISTVSIRRRSWSGGRLGTGTPTDADLVLDPVPRVGSPTPHDRSSEAGKYEEGDLVADRISLTYTEDQLSGGLSASQELFWLIDGEAYRVISVEERYLQWRVQLGRMRNRS